MRYVDRRPVVEPFPDDLVVVVDQRRALALVDETAAALEVRSDTRASFRAVLRALVPGMDWDTGDMAAVSHEVLAAKVAKSERTVSRMVEMAKAAGLLVETEAPLSARANGGHQGRTPGYVFVTRRPVTVELGDPPSPVERGSAVGREVTLVRARRVREAPAWGLRDRATSRGDGDAATDLVLARTGLTGRVPRRQARGMLAEWWRAGWCVAGVLHALDHHPDRPTLGRGDATAGAREPLALLGHRLAPWRGRGVELPPAVQAVDRAERLARAARRDADEAPPLPPSAHRPTSTPEARAAALALVRAPRLSRVVGGRSRRPEGAAHAPTHSSRAERTPR